jgi:hypothetical protein
MYSWYFPKDEPSTGIGHRHDWEGVIVWLKDSTTISADNVVAVCPSAHGGWDCTTDGFTLDGTASLIKYESIWPIDHSCGLTTTVGGTQPLVAWESMSSKFSAFFSLLKVMSLRYLCANTISYSCCPECFGYYRLWIWKCSFQ